MKANLQYLWYVLRHKWFVFVECLKLGVPIWIAILHDWDKFLPGEWFPYVNYFYRADLFPEYVFGEARNHGIQNKADMVASFAHAWMLHQHRNKHHWQYYLNAGTTPISRTNVLVWDKGNASIIINGSVHDWSGLISIREPMPDVYRREMLADWRGAGRAVGKSDTAAWYLANKKNMQLDYDTRCWIEHTLFPAKFAVGQKVHICTDNYSCPAIVEEVVDNRKLNLYQYRVTPEDTNQPEWYVQDFLQAD